MAIAAVIFFNAVISRSPANLSTHYHKKTNPLLVVSCSSGQNCHASMRGVWTISFFLYIPKKTK